MGGDKNRKNAAKGKSPKVRINRVALYKCYVKYMIQYDAGTIFALFLNVINLVTNYVMWVFVRNFQKRFFCYSELM